MSPSYQNNGVNPLSFQSVNPTQISKDVQGLDSILNDSKQVQQQQHPLMSAIEKRKNGFEPIDDFLQCHFEPGDWKEINNAGLTHNLVAKGPIEKFASPDVVEDEECEGMEEITIPDHHHHDSHKDDCEECDFSDYSCDDKYCNINITDWGALETCNDMIRCNLPEKRIRHDNNTNNNNEQSSLSSLSTDVTPSLTSSPRSTTPSDILADPELNTMFYPANSNYIDANGNFKILEPELANVSLLSSTKTSHMRSDLQKHRAPILHPERPHIHEHFPPSNPNHHYHLHYQNHYKGSLIQHDLILPSNFQFDQVGHLLGGVGQAKRDVTSDASSPVHLTPRKKQCVNVVSKHASSSLAPDLTTNLPSTLSSDIPPSLPSSVPSGLPPSLPSSVPPSLPSNLPPNLVCKWDDCNLAMPGSDLNKHMFQQHWTHDWIEQETQNQDCYQCEWLNCMFTTKELDKLLEHIDAHAANKVKPTVEKEEPKVRHICRWLGDDKKECGMEFPDTGALTDHIVAEHVKSGKSHYVCHWAGCARCGRPFAQRQKIIRHLNTHTKHKPFVCSICGKHFSLSLMLKQHMRTHTGERPYRCKICGKHFKTSSSLTIHTRIHSGDKPMVCKICGKRFNESSNLNKHLKIHNRKYRCDLCKRSFNTKDRFLKHLAMCEMRNRKSKGNNEGSNVSTKAVGS